MELTIVIIVVSIVFLFGIGLFLFIKMQQKKLGIVAKKSLYADTDEKPGDILYSTTLPLLGKPDYIIHDKQQYVPVEVKTGRTPMMPYMSHVMQLIAYCILVEENYHHRPTYGVIRYPDREFTINFTEHYERSFRAIIADMMQYKQRKKEMKKEMSRFLCGNCKNIRY